MARKTDPLDLDNAVNLYKTGLSLKDVEKRSGVAMSVLHRELKARSIPPRAKPFTDDAEIVAAYVGGMSEFAVAKRFDMGRTAVRIRLKKAGVAIRGISDASALRWVNMTPEQRVAQITAAHAAVKGSNHVAGSQILSAITAEAAGRFDSASERDLAALLNARGLDIVPQKAFGPYNCDLAIDPVSVEVWGGNFHFSGEHLARTPERLRYLMDCGWNVICVQITGRHPLTPAMADYVASYVEETRRNPSAVREYRVVRGAGEVISSGRADDHEITIVMPTRRGLKVASGDNPHVTGQAVGVSER